VYFASSVECTRSGRWGGDGRAGFDPSFTPGSDATSSGGGTLPVEELAPWSATIVSRRSARIVLDVDAAGIGVLLVDDASSRRSAEVEARRSRGIDVQDQFSRIVRTIVALPPASSSTEAPAHSDRRVRSRRERRIDSTHRSATDRTVIDDEKGVTQAVCRIDDADRSRSPPRSFANRLIRAIERLFAARTRRSVR